MHGKQGIGENNEGLELTRDLVRVSCMQGGGVCLVVVFLGCLNPEKPDFGDHLVVGQLQVKKILES